MNTKLRSSEHKIIGIVLVVSAISLIISVKYFGHVFPEAAIEFRVNRRDSRPIAQRFLAARGISVEGYRHTAIFTFDDDAKVYLERTQGLSAMDRLTRGPIHLWRWSHRWFKPGQEEEYRVDVTPTGQVVGFDHKLPESAPGASLTTPAARAIAENFLQKVMKRDLDDLQFVEGETEKRPARIDHFFTWKQKNVNLGDGSLRIEVAVAGNKITRYREFVRIPEQWSRGYQRLRSRNLATQLVDEFFYVLLTIGLLILLVRRLRDRDVPLRLAFIFGAVAALLYFLGRLNSFSLFEFGYQTTDSYASFLAGFIRTSLLSSLGVGSFIFLLVGGSEPVYREGCPQLLSLRRVFSWRGLRSRSFLIANVVGIGLTFFFFAYQTVFYLAANKLGAWAPADVPFSNLLNTRIPWVLVLFTGFFPAVSEEMQFRAFAIPFLRRIFRSGFLGLVLAAFIWGFLHAAYPNQPFYIRGLEVGFGGIIVGLIMLRFGILATLIWHYSVDALYTAFLLLRSPNHYLMMSGAVSAGIMLIPLAVCLIAYLLTGTFSDESALTNANVGVSRLPGKEAIEEEVAPLAYAGLSRRRIVLAVVVAAAFFAIALVPVYRFGESVHLRISRRQAEHSADAFLRQQGVQGSDYRRSAWLHENVDPQALKYLLEHLTIKESEKIYQKATRFVLWEVRYFRPLKKEEYRVFVNVGTGRVFTYRHLLNEDAPGASPSPEQATAIAEKFIRLQGYRLDDFDLQSSEAKKRKARTDYTLTWQAKSGDVRNVGQAHYRLRVDLAGNKVVGFSRYFKLPESWQRAQNARYLPNDILIGIYYLLLASLTAGGLILFVRQLRRGEIRWRLAAKVGVFVLIAAVLGEMNQLPIFGRQYDTSVPLDTFRLLLGVELLVVPLLAGLLAWLLVALATSLYPKAWLVFRGSARHVWRRDALVAVVVSVAAAAGVARMDALLASRFHQYASVDASIFPNLFDSFSPAVGYFLHSLIWAVFYLAVAGLVIYAIKRGITKRAWWFWLGLLAFLVCLGPARAHSVPEFFLNWGMSLIVAAVAVVLISVFFRDNVLAYVAAVFCVILEQPVAIMLSQPSAFLRWNGVALLVLVLVVLWWMLVPIRRRSTSD